MITKEPTDPAIHRAQAAALFNGTWELLERSERTADDDLRMIHMAHASRFHWDEVGTAEEHSVGEWQVARVYAILGRAEPARFHAEACLRICEMHGIDGWRLAYAHEALARAARVAGDDQRFHAHLALAEKIAATVDDAEDRAQIEGDFATLRR